MVQSTRSGGGGRAICYRLQAEGCAELWLAMAAMMARRMVWPSNAEARVSEEQKLEASIPLDPCIDRKG